MGVAADLFQLIGEVNTLTSFVQNLLGNQQAQATKADMLANFALTNQLITLTYNALTANTEQERQIWSDLISRLGGLGVQVGVPQQATQPVNLPATPPPGYGGLSGSATASAVWNFSSADEATPMQTVMAALSVFLRVVGDSLAFAPRLSEGFVINFAPYDLINNSSTSFGDWTVASILPTHTSILNWLNDVYFHQSWVATPDGQYWANITSPSGFGLVFCTLTPGEFEWYKATNAGKLLLPTVPPVWPGLSGVTLLSTHTIAPPGEAITIDCDGVIVDITGVPSWAGKFDFGGVTSWRNIGGMSFTNDNGEEEFPQTWGFEHVIYMPKSMSHASGYVYRAAIGVSGTITPFVIT